MFVRRIKETELIEARNIAAVSFNFPHDSYDKDSKDYIEELKANPFSKCDVYYMDTIAAFTEEGDMMSCISLIPYVVTFDRNPYKMTGIGGVCTYPQHRRKGAVRECFQYALEEMYKQGITFSYLYPFSEKFYSNFGFIPSTPNTLWNLDLNTIPDYRYDGSFTLYRGDKTYRGFDIVYDAFASRYNMMVRRDSYDWAVLKEANPYKGKRFAFLYRDKSNTPRGYLIFEKSKEEGKRILSCKEMIYDNFPALKALMSFAKTFSADYDAIEFYAPSCLNLDYFCKDYSQSNSFRSIRQNGMVRVINAYDVLKNAIYKGSGELTLLIEDTCLKENNQIFHVMFEDGAAFSITNQEGAHKMGPDVKMSINQFSAAITGKYDVCDFEFQEDILVYCELEKLSKVFYKKPGWINNYF